MMRRRSGYTRIAKPIPPEKFAQVPAVEVEEEIREQLAEYLHRFRLRTQGIVYFEMSEASKVYLYGEADIILAIVKDANRCHQR